MTPKINNIKSHGPHSKSARKEQRNSDAIGRDLSRLSRSNEDQMDLISLRRGNSRKEMAQLVGTGPRVTIHMPEAN